MNAAIEKKEFGDDIISSAGKVAVIMTQDWCPQWHSMDRYIGKLSTENLDVDIYEIVYNKENYYKDFMKFKEIVFKNFSIPYVRYYLNGVFTGESNYMSKNKFLKYLGF